MEPARTLFDSSCGKLTALTTEAPTMMWFKEDPRVLKALYEEAECEKQSSEISTDDLSSTSNQDTVAGFA